MRENISQSLQGTTHPRNEDGLLYIEENNYQLFFVFDGVSMAANSDMAVQIAGDYIKANYRQYYKNSDYSLIDLMYDINQNIINSNIVEALTTYCALFCEKGGRKAKFSNLGDSRIYSLTDRTIEQLSVDDSLYPGSNVITRCLGTNYLEKSDFREDWVSADAGRFLLCTDGFYSFLEGNKKHFIDLLNQPDLLSIKIGLKELISGRNRDDATYILII